jgi:hypothetical protein
LTIVVISACKNTFSKSSVINEGVGVDKYSIKNLKTENVTEELGKTYVLINHHNYSVEILYKKYGVSFYYLLSKPTDIFSIAFNRNYKGKTSMGFIIQKMNVNDLLQLYGTPRWNRLEDTIYAHYDSLGLYFAIIPIEEKPAEFQSYSLDNSATLKKMDSYYRSVYKNEMISEISIGTPTTEF